MVRCMGMSIDAMKLNGQRGLKGRRTSRRIPSTATSSRRRATTARYSSGANKVANGMLRAFNPLWLRQITQFCRQKVFDFALHTASGKHARGEDELCGFQGSPRRHRQ